MKHVSTQTSKCRGGTLGTFYQTSSILIVKYEVKLFAESEGMRIKDNKEV